MPGFILHLTAAQILLKRLPHHPDFPYEISSVNDFLIGNLLPDTTKQKDASHFRNPAYYEKMMVFPDLTRFLQKYSFLLSDSSVLGYYFHLYPLDLNPEVVNPGISEICYKDVQEVLLQLHGFLAVSPEAVRELKVFPLKKLLLALEEYVEEFLSVPNKYL